MTLHSYNSLGFKKDKKKKRKRYNSFIGEATGALLGVALVSETANAVSKI